MAKRVLIYTNHYSPEQFKINDIVDWLKEEKYEIRVITGLPNYPSGKIYKGYGIFSNKLKEVKHKLIINRLPLIPRGNGSKIMLTANYLSYFISAIFFTFYIIIFKKRYEIVLVHHTSPFLVSIPPIFYRLTRSSKNILWDLDIWPQTLKAMGVIKNKILIALIEYIVKLIYKFYDRILVSSESLKLFLRSRANENKIVFFPNWADQKIELSNSSTDNMIVNPNFLNIIYMGNIGEAQDFYSLITSVEILEEKKFKFYIIGEGRYKSKFQRIVNSKNLESKIIFIDHQDINDVFAYANQADLLFLSLKNEEIFQHTLPAKLSMYMSIGKPILAMISGEANNLINNSKIGIAVESGDYVNLAKVISNFLEKRYNIDKMGKNSKHVYETKFKSELRKKQLIDLIEQI